MNKGCQHEWIEDSEGEIACFFCGKDGVQSTRNFLTICVECGITYLGSGGRGLCNSGEDRLGMSEVEVV